MNVRLLRRIQKHILAEPKRFLMDTFVETSNYPGATFSDYDAHSGDSETFARCGTAACIGGWACILSGRKPKAVERLLHPDRVAKRELGLDAKSAKRLFNVGSWPDQFQYAYRSEPKIAKRVKLSVQRIEHFIKTKGLE